MSYNNHRNRGQRNGNNRFDNRPEYGDRMPHDHGRDVPQRDDPRPMPRPPRPRPRPIFEPRPERPSMPTGSHPSKTSLEVKSDPLYLELFMRDAGGELVPIVEEINHFTGFDGLTSLIDETFGQICVHSKNFRESVSHAMYAYYIAVNSWSRALNVMIKNRYSVTLEERRLVSMIYEKPRYVVPKSISMYLSGIGNITILSGVESKFRLKKYMLQADTGYFRNYETLFYLATSYPCISTFAQRMCEDVRFTNTGADPDWLPENIVQVWSTKALGYHHAMHQPPRIMQMLQRLGVTEDFNNFPSSIDVYKINIALMNAIDHYLKQVPNLDVADLPSEINGSTGQFIIADPIDTRLECVTYVSKSPFQITGSINYLGGAFLYRINKNLTATLAKPLFPYEIANPTAIQIATLNHLQEGWSPIFNSIYYYENIAFNPRVREYKIVSLDFKIR